MSKFGPDFATQLNVPPKLLDYIEQVATDHKSVVSVPFDTKPEMRTYYSIIIRTMARVRSTCTARKREVTEAMKNARRLGPEFVAPPPTDYQRDCETLRLYANGVTFSRTEKAPANDGKFYVFILPPGAGRYAAMTERATVITVDQYRALAL